MGCGGSKPEPLPKDAPPDWAEKATATFKLLDKSGTGFISTVPFKKWEDFASEISVLGPEVGEKQKEVGDFELKVALAKGSSGPLALSDWVTLMEAKANDKGWGAVDALLKSIEGAVNAGDAGAVDAMARSTFKSLDADWCDKPNTGKVKVKTELGEIGDSTDKKMPTMCSLIEDGEIDVETWVKAAGAASEKVGWPRAKMELTVLAMRLAKVKELDDMM